MSTSRTGVILAAGFGSRLRGHSGATVKPLTLVAGVPLIHRALRGLELAGCDDLVVVVGYRGDELAATIGASWRGRELRFVDNPRYDLANGVSLLAARPHVQDEFVVAMADHVVGDEVMVLAAAHRPAAGGATLLVDRRIDAVFDLDDATKVRTRGSRLVAIGKQLSEYDCIDVGVFVCTHGLMDALQQVRNREGDASLSRGVTELAARDAMSVLDIGDGFWQDVDTPEMLAHAERRLASRAT
jgi:choline kinase